MCSKMNDIIKLSNSIQLKEKLPDTLTNWMRFYFELEVTTSSGSQKMQRFDLELLINYMKQDLGREERKLWTSRFSKSFVEYLKSVIDERRKKRRWNDRSINRILAHLKTFAKWIHKLSPFPLGNPMVKIKMMQTTTGLEIERALIEKERSLLLDAADFLVQTGGISRDRNRYRKKERPVRKGFRPFRNRAIIYTLIETGMRRTGICNLKTDDIDFKSKSLTVLEKGGIQHTYLISGQGLAAIADYIKNERDLDNEKWQSQFLFLTTVSNSKGSGNISSRMINNIWNEVCTKAGIEGRTPHSARHGMGRHIIDKTGNIAAVQRQLGHRNAAYSMQYARITAEELRDVLDDR